VAGAPGDDGGGGPRLKRELSGAPATEGAPASGKLRAPRKKCSACHAHNPTAQQACQACGARFTIKSKAKATKAKSEASAGGLGGLSAALGPQLGLGSIQSALAAGGVHLPNTLGGCMGALGQRSGPHVTFGPDGRLQFHDAPLGASGAPLDLQAILNASAVLNSSGAPIGADGAAECGVKPEPLYDEGGFELPGSSELLAPFGDAFGAGADDLGDARLAGLLGALAQNSTPSELLGSR
ncbi:hypothetical protein T492DRAFT_239107, partial [Pavlovales sp. CCMP2436]